MVDFTIRRGEPDYETLILSFSFSSVLREDSGAVLVSFRDVTVDRATEVELTKTKDFLERVIESSVDAIVSADMDGLVLLFNRAAERIYGYDAREVVGVMRIRDLYPSGSAEQIMRLIYAKDHGGPGRLEGYQTEVLAKDRTRIPVHLAAALIFENGIPVGSVGIFTDLRERMRMEARLTEAQEELRAREKQAIVAELAGAAAHELNQPLTSVLGYAELICRRLDESSPIRAAAVTIRSEAERMAEIVRKIGKITRYETKSYVGAAKIIDLDRSSGDDPNRVIG
jgi:PAS domain S-box-containing protein